MKKLTGINDNLTLYRFIIKSIIFVKNLMMKYPLQKMIQRILHVTVKKQ